MSCVGVIDLVDGQLTIQGVAGDEKTTVWLARGRRTSGGEA